jgi:uncharacterized membrane protein
MKPTALPAAPTSGQSGRNGRGKTAGLAFVFLWFFIGGIAHFVATDTEARIVPPWMPWPIAAVLVSGVFELLAPPASWCRAPARRPASACSC